MHGLSGSGIWEGHGADPSSTLAPDAPSSLPLPTMTLSTWLPKKPTTILSPDMQCWWKRHIQTPPIPSGKPKGMFKRAEWSESHSVVSDSLQPHGLKPTRPFCPWGFPGRNTGVGCQALLQGIVPTQGSNPSLPRCRQILYHLSHQGSPVILEWVA